MLSKKELVEKLAKKQGVTKRAAEESINAMIEVFKEAVINDGGIQITGVVSIGVKTLKAKTVINPATKQPMQTKESITLSIKTGKTFKDELNG